MEIAVRDEARTVLLSHEYQAHSSADRREDETAKWIVSPERIRVVGTLDTQTLGRVSRVDKQLGD